MKQWVPRDVAMSETLSDVDGTLHKSSLLIYMVRTVKKVKTLYTLPAQENKIECFASHRVGNHNMVCKQKEIF